MSAPVFLVDSSHLRDYKVGDKVLLDGDEGRHAGTVQRKRPGEHVDLVDGQGTRLRCQVQDVQKSGVTLDVEEVITEPAPNIEVTLVQALAKGDRDEQAIEMATEAGIDKVLPWQADRSIVIWRGARAAKSQARWLATIRAATKQSRRAFLPKLENDVNSKELANLIKGVTENQGVVYVLHESGENALASDPVFLTLQDAVQTTEILIVIGPEGGITETELQAFEKNGARIVRLGPGVLRTSTAGVVALSLLSLKIGRWN